MGARVRVVVTVDYEIDDELHLRAAAVARDGDINYNPGDAVMHLLKATGRDQLELPGTTVVRFGLSRDTSVE